MSQLVGVIHIRSGNFSDCADLIYAIENWTVKNGWEPHLRVCFEPGYETTEIAFIPGENQSNPQIRFAFNAVPDFSQLQFRLMHWLYELM